MDSLIKLNSSRVGRDKIFRTLQYALRAINSRPYLATDESRDLEKTLASFRKLLRLGTFIDVLQSARSSIHHPDIFNRIVVTLSRIASAMFLLGDHVVWLHRNKIINVQNVNEWQKFSNKSWLYSIILNLVKDYRALKTVKGQPDKAVIVDTLKNAADFWLPMSSLGHVDVSPAFVGMMGVVSSLLSALPIIDVQYKFL